MAYQVSTSHEVSSESSSTSISPVILGPIYTPSIKWAPHMRCQVDQRDRLHSPDTTEFAYMLTWYIDTIDLCCECPPGQFLTGDSIGWRGYGSLLFACKLDQIKYRETIEREREECVKIMVLLEPIFKTGSFGILLTKSNCQDYMYVLLFAWKN